MAAHATQLGEKLRQEGFGADHITVFCHTSEHDLGAPVRSDSTEVTLPEATNDNPAADPGSAARPSPHLARAGQPVLALLEGRRGDDRPRAAGRLAAGADRSAGPRACLSAHRRDG